jgi:hypothetical protein
VANVVEFGIENDGDVIWDTGDQLLKLVQSFGPLSQPESQVGFVRTHQVSSRLNNGLAEGQQGIARCRSGLR